jgi:hypothetical protein
MRTIEKDSKRDCERAAERLISVTFTRDELIALVNTLAVAIDEARKSVQLAVTVNPVYPTCYALREKQREATRSHLRRTVELYNMLNDRWKEEQ